MCRRGGLARLCGRHAGPPALGPPTRPLDLGLGGRCGGGRTGLVWALAAGREVGRDELVFLLQVCVAPYSLARLRLVWGDVDDDL